MSSRLSRGRVRRLLVALAVLPLFAADHAPAQTGSVAGDKAALVALYDATDGANWTTGTNWTSDEALSSWHGVTTNGDGRVTALDLDDNGLGGTLPAALGDLRELQQLDLGDNALTGALPAELTNLSKLTSVLLGRSRALTGPLPNGLRELADLTNVQISDTELCAPDDDAWQAWLATITFSGLICPPAEQSVIDVAVFYTPAAREWSGGIDEVETLIDVMVASTNTAYTNSGVNQRIALVAVEETAYTESNSDSTDIWRLVGRSDGHMDEVHTIRDRVAADIVVLARLGDTVSSAQVILQPMSPSFDAFSIPAFATFYLPGGALVFAHELGHLMGLAHDRWQACSGLYCHSTAFPYAYGYVNQRAFESDALHSQRWHTIMSYSEQCDDSGISCSRAPYFSTPDRTYLGDPLGIAGLAPSHSRTDGPADAARALNRTRAYVANFRQAPDITVSFGSETYTATESGAAATVTVQLSAAPTRPIDIPLTSYGTMGATAYDYTGVPSAVRFGRDETEKTFTVTAVNDAADDDGESVTLGFGESLPAGVTAGSVASSTVNLTDNDDVDGAPSILTVELTSDPGSDTLYVIGDEIEASVRFNKTVTVRGTPQLGLTVGSRTRQATYRSTAGEVLRFAYPVGDGDRDENGVSIAANSLLLNGGTIRDGDNQDAARTHSAVPASANHRVDAVRPVLEAATVNFVTLRLAYDGALDETSIPAADAFTVRVDGVVHDVGDIAVHGSEISLTLSRAVPYGEGGVTVSYRPGLPPIRDVVGNPAAALSNQAVTSEVLDYDTDADGLIEIENLAQLNAVRYDPDGDGVPYTAGATVYWAAFPDAETRMYCANGCAGYELFADLDFDTNGNGRADAGDAYWNSGAGWLPIEGLGPSPPRTTFEGNGHTVAGLFIDRSGPVGLFGRVWVFGDVLDVGVVGASVTSRSGEAGALVGINEGDVIGCYATGAVTGQTAGGLVGLKRGRVRLSYAAVRVTGTANAGGLIGRQVGVDALVIASYATGSVSGMGNVGGLVGGNRFLTSFSSKIEASYATGPLSVSGSGSVGGLVADSLQSTIAASYWDTSTSGQTTGTLGQGQTTANLQAPTGYTGIYADWNLDVDFDGTNDAPWDFGLTDEYPVLAADVDGNGEATWQEFGHQLRTGPTLTATANGGTVALSWKAVDTSAWTTAPEVTYTVTRDDGTTTTLIGEALDGLTDTDTPVPVGATYTYQVTVVVDGGESVRSARVTVVGVAPNQPPAVVGTLAPQTLRIANGAVSVEVSGAFSDPESDELTYGATSSAPTVASVSVSGSTITVTPLAAGVATITVTATDVEGLNQSASLAFVVTVPNRSPVAVGALADRSARVSDGVFTVDVSGAFSDPDSDALTYRASSSAASIASVTVSGSIVSVTPLSGGTATVTVTATDTAGSNTSATQTFTVTVANRSPMAVGTLAALSLRVADGARSVNVSGAFEDPDGNPLTYDAWSSSESVATVSLSGSTVTVTPVSGGTATITVTAEDAGGLSATQTLAVTVANRSPGAVGTLAPLSLQVPDGTKSVSVSAAFEDPDGDSLTYGASSSSPSVATVSVSGAAVEVTPVSGGTSTVTVTATDVEGSSTSATQRFAVTVANRSPGAVGRLPPLTRRVADGAVTVEVSGAFRDPDSDVLTYGASSSDASVARARASGSTVTVTPVSDGAAEVTVTATDVAGSNTSAEQTIQVTVPENAGPEAVRALGSKALGATNDPLPVVVSGAFRDPDRDALTYQASSSDESVVTVRVSGSTVTLTPVSDGTAVVTVTATDAGGSNTSATQTFAVTVGENRSPEPVGSLPALRLLVPDGARTVEVSGAFRDRDNDDLTYGTSSSDTSVATVSVSGSTVTVTPVLGGTATVTVTARDAGGSNTTATQTFVGTVANQTPEAVGQLASRSLRVEDGAQTVDVSFAFRDPEDDALTYRASSSSPSVATVSISGSTVEVTPVSGGTATVTVTARDAGGSNTTATQTFEATVANRAPVAVGRLAVLSLRVPDGMRSVNVSDAFDDPDRDVLAYGAVSSSPAVAAASVSGSTVRVEPVSSGRSEVTVTAEDAGGLRAEQAFEVTVANRSPVRVGQLPVLSRAVEEGPATVDVSGAFTDPDDDALTYDATSSVATVAAVAVSGSVVTVTPLSRGTTTVAATATDADGSKTSATQTFGVSVTGGPDPGGGGGGGRNRGPEAVGMLADRTLEPGAVESVDVSSAFRDRDRDVLTFAAESSAVGVASAAVVAVASGVVTVTALSVGEAEVTVTATDAEGSNRSVTQTFTVTVTHDADADGLIGIHTLAQLDAVRHDLDGDGAPAAAGTSAYAAAFGVTGRTVSCGESAACVGYELGTDLDFDTNRSGSSDSGDAYWDGGSGWLPIGTTATPFTATFEGNGRVIRHLCIARGDGAGLFGATGTSSAIRHVGLIAVEVTGGDAVGALVGLNAGLVTGSYATGRVSGGAAVGGLAGANPGAIGVSYAAVQVNGETWAGGLVGFNDGQLTAGYATGRVSGTRRVGGLIGLNRGALTAGYATGRVAGDAETGGLTGATEPPGAVTAGYWDTDTSGDAAEAAGRGQPTSALQQPTDYAGLYAAWNVDVDGDGAADAPWHFGTDAQYPALSLDVDGDGRATWQEAGRQLRAGPIVTAAPKAEAAEVTLTWTPVDATAWTPSPAVTYTVHRQAGARVETVAKDVRGMRHVDGAVQSGTTFTYQVAAVVDGGEAVRSARVAVEVPCSYTVTPLHQDVLWTAATGEVSVTTGPACGWTAASESAFLTVTAGAAGRGSGTVTYTVAANEGGPRTGALLLAGQRVTVFQASPTVFTDHPIEPGATPVKAIHFLELRKRIDALRSRAEVPPFDWTDPTLIPGVTPIRRVHLTELRTALARAYVAAGQPAPTWSDTTVPAGVTVIEAAHLMELRAAVLALEDRRASAGGIALAQSLRTIRSATAGLSTVLVASHAAGVAAFEGCLRDPLGDRECIA